jgi:hypothetical protein
MSPIVLMIGKIEPLRQIRAMPRTAPMASGWRYDFSRVEPRECAGEDFRQGEPDVNVGPNTACGGKDRERPCKVGNACLRN